MSGPDRRFALTRVLEKEPRFLWRVIMVREAISEFANMVARKFPVGSNVPFRLSGTADERFAGVVSKTQMVPESLAGTGLLVECDEKTTSHIRRFEPWSIYGKQVLIHWHEILEESPCQA